MSRHRHVLDVYGTTLHLATTPKSLDKIRKQMPGAVEDIGAIGGTCTVLEHHDGGATTYHVVFWVDFAAHDGDALRLVNTAAHEAAHGAGFLFDHIGQSYGGDSEAFAYLVGWLTEWIVSHLPRIPQS